MGLFTRKRPPLYVWNDDWEPNVQIFDDIPTGEEWTWTCSADYYYHLIALTFSYTIVPLVHNVVLYGSLDLAQHRLMTWGMSNFNQAGTLVMSWEVVNLRNLVALPNSRSYNHLPDYAYITPGMSLRLHSHGIGGADQIDYVSLYAKRWRLR